MLQGRRKKVSYKSKLLVDVPKAQWFRVEGTHNAIISPGLFQAVQRGLDLRAKTDGAGQIHPLSGLVRCMDCGCSMSRTTNGRPGEKRRSYLRCRRYADSGSVKGCTRHSIRLDRLIDAVSDALRRHIQDCCPLDTPAPLPRELAVLLIEKIEIGEKDRETDRQEVRVTWLF